MNQELSKLEREKILNLVFEKPDKACAVAQCLLDYLQAVSLSDYADAYTINKRTVQNNSDKLKGVKIGNRKFVRLIQ